MKILIIFIILLVLICFCRSCYEVTHFKKTAYAVKCAKIKNPKSIVFLSDLHDCQYGKQNQKLVNTIKGLHPDAIICAGDLLSVSKLGKMQNRVHFKNACILLKEISKIAPVYYAFGNHETKSEALDQITGGAMSEFLDALSDMNVHLLRNQSCYLDHDICITGLEIDSALYERNCREDSMPAGYMEKMLGQSGREQFQILIAHNPLYFKQYAAWNADLVFSGHNHGNIIHIPFLGGLLSPNLEIFGKYEKGIYHEKSSAMILSAGLGTHTLKVRFLNMPEVISVELLPSASEKIKVEKYDV